MCFVLGIQNWRHKSKGKLAEFFYIDSFPK